MKYYVYSFIWGRSGEDLTNCGTDFWKGSLLGLYAHLAVQPEKQVLVSYAEITEHEYEQREKFPDL